MSATRACGPLFGVCLHCRTMAPYGMAFCPACGEEQEYGITDMPSSDAPTIVPTTGPTPELMK